MARKKETPPTPEPSPEEEIRDATSVYSEIKNSLEQNQLDLSQFSGEELKGLSYEQLTSVTGDIENMITENGTTLGGLTAEQAEKIEQKKGHVKLDKQIAELEATQETLRSQLEEFDKLVRERLEGELRDLKEQIKSDIKNKKQVVTEAKQVMDRPEVQQMLARDPSLEKRLTQLIGSIENLFAKHEAKVAETSAQESEQKLQAQTIEERVRELGLDQKIERWLNGLAGDKFYEKDIMTKLRNEFGQMFRDDKELKKSLGFDSLNAKELQAVIDRYFLAFQEQLTQAVKQNQFQEKGFMSKVKREVKQGGRTALGAALYTGISKVATAITGPVGSVINVGVRGVVGAVNSAIMFGAGKAWDAAFSKDMKKLATNVHSSRWAGINQELKDNLAALIAYDTGRNAELKKQQEMVATRGIEFTDTTNDQNEVTATADQKRQQMERLIALTEQFTHEAALSGKDREAALAERHLVIAQARESGALSQFVDGMVAQKLKETIADKELKKLPEEAKNKLILQVQLAVERDMDLLLADAVLQEKFSLGQGTGEKDNKFFKKLYDSKLFSSEPPESVMQAMWKGFRSGAVAGAISADATAGAVYMGLMRVQGTFRAEIMRRGQEGIIKTSAEIISELQNLSYDTLAAADINQHIKEARAYLKLPDIKEGERARIENEIIKLQNLMVMKADNAEAADDVVKKIINRQNETQQRANEVSKQAKDTKKIWKQIVVFWKDMDRKEKGKLLLKMFGEGAKGMAYGAIGSTAVEAGTTFGGDAFWDRVDDTAEMYANRVTFGGFDKLTSDHEPLAADLAARNEVDEELRDLDLFDVKALGGDGTDPAALTEKLHSYFDTLGYSQEEVNFLLADLGGADGIVSQEELETAGLVNTETESLVNEGDLKAAMAERMDINKWLGDEERLMEVKVNAPEVFMEKFNAYLTEGFGAGEQIDLTTFEKIQAAENSETLLKLLAEQGRIERVAELDMYVPEGLMPDVNFTDGLSKDEIILLNAYANTPGDAQELATRLLIAAEAKNFPAFNEAKEELAATKSELVTEEMRERVEANVPAVETAKEQVVDATKEQQLSKEQQAASEKALADLGIKADVKLTPEQFAKVQSADNHDNLLKLLEQQGKVAQFDGKYYNQEALGIGLTDGKLDQQEYMKLLDEIDSKGEASGEAQELFKALLDNEETREAAEKYVATVNKGQGITQALVRQMRLDHTLAEKLGLSEKDLASDLKLGLAARELAEKAGYIKYDEAKIVDFITELKAHPDQFDALPDSISSITDEAERDQAIDKWVAGHDYTVARAAGAVEETWVKAEDVAGYQLEIGEDGKLHIQEVDITEMKEVADLGSKFEYQHQYKPTVEFTEPEPESEEVSLEDILKEHPAEMTTAEKQFLGQIRNYHGETKLQGVYAEDAKEKAADYLKVAYQSNPELIDKYTEFRIAMHDIYSQDMNSELHDNGFLGLGSPDHEDLYSNTIELSKLSGLNGTEAKLFAAYLMQDHKEMDADMFKDMMTDKKFDEAKFSQRVTTFSGELHSKDLPEGDKWTPRTIKVNGVEQAVLMHKTVNGGFEYQKTDGNIIKVANAESVSAIMQGKEMPQTETTEKLADQVKELEKGKGYEIKTEKTVEQQGDRRVSTENVIGSFSGEAAKDLHEFSVEHASGLLTGLRNHSIDSPEDMVSKIKGLTGSELSKSEQKSWELQYKAYEKNPNSPLLQQKLEVQMQSFLMKHMDVIERQNQTVETPSQENDADRIVKNIVADKTAADKNIETAKEQVKESAQEKVETPAVAEADDKGGSVDMDSLLHKMIEQNTSELMKGQEGKSEYLQNMRDYALELGKITQEQIDSADPKVQAEVLKSVTDIGKTFEQLANGNIMKDIDEIKADPNRAHVLVKMLENNLESWQEKANQKEPPENIRQMIESVQKLHDELQRTLAADNKGKTKA